jgi:hypothetical protein
VPRDPSRTALGVGELAGKGFFAARGFAAAGEASEQRAGGAERGGRGHVGSRVEAVGLDAVVEPPRRGTGQPDTPAGFSTELSHPWKCE